MIRPVQSSESRGRVSRVLLMVLAIPVLLALIAWATVAMLFPPAKVRSMVQQQLEGVLARPATYRDARVGLWPPVRLTVIEPALAEPGGFRAGSALTLRALHLDLDVFALLSRKIVVRRVVLDGPRVHLVLNEDGSTNFDRLTKEQPAAGPDSKPMDIEVRELEIHDGQVLTDAVRARRRVMFGIATRSAISTEAQGSRFATSGRTTISGLAFGPITAAKLSDLDASLGKLEWKIDHRGKYDAKQNRLALEQLALAFGGTSIGVSGLVDQPGPESRVDLKAKASGVDLAQIMGFLSAADAAALHGIEAAGVLDFDLGIRGAMGPGHSPRIIGVLTVKEGRFRYPNAPARVESLSFTTRFAPDSLGIGDLRANVVGSGGATPLRARLAVTHFADPNVVFAVQGDVDLAAVTPMIAPRETQLGGRVALDVRGRGRANDPGSIALEGNAKLSNVSVAAPDLPNRIEAINGTIAFSPQRAKVSGLTGKGGKSSFMLDADVTRPLALLAKPGSAAPSGVTFSLVSPHLDLAELLPTSKGAPLVPNATGGGEVRIARLMNQKLDVRDVRAAVTLEPGVIAIPRFALDGYDGHVTGNARFDLTQPESPRFAVNAHIDSVEADAILSAWTPLRGLFKGRLGTTLDLSGAGATPEAIARTLSAAGLAAFLDGTFGPAPAIEAIAKQLKLDPGRLTRVRDLRLPFHIANGRVVTDKANMRTPFGIWIVSGGVGFDGSLDYVVSASFPRDLVPAPEASSLLGVGALTDAQGNLLADLRVTGTARAPRVSLDLAATGARVKGRISEALTQQSEKVQQELRDEAERRRRAAEDSLRAVAARARRLS
ncbi:MAG: AsmA family protein, partial [Candidatus Eisenbacteria bacterium]|nr:AsmA family protein [Candidatus Eisenbacteria bacterium]